MKTISESFTFPLAAYDRDLGRVVREFVNDHWFQYAPLDEWQGPQSVTYSDGWANWTFDEWNEKCPTWDLLPLVDGEPDETEYETITYVLTEEELALGMDISEPIVSEMILPKPATEWIVETDRVVRTFRRVEITAITKKP